MSDDNSHGFRDMSEADWEAYALDALGELGWEHVRGTAVAPGIGGAGVLG